ncbi:hypothetical protein [Dyadobacter sp. CY343]|uniref:hypothetical protein n=1 Tax=Dyadobacter sp. CY343 TaxID=2907299 RepID=UPI001F3887DE|nr:hypothetical protein [Dyadobacter sp. CY343]MCE7062543.1 hypothetical protein [Dyadobacter sp. CY343]
MRQLYLAFLAIFLTVTVYGQPASNRYSTNGISGKKSYNRKEKQPVFLTLRGGMTQFFGELNEQDMQMVIGLSLGKYLTKEFAIQTDYNAGKVGGQKSRFFNSYFINEFNTIELLAKWDLTEQFNRLEPGPLHLSVYGGFGQIYFAANAFDLDNNEMVRFTNSKLSARNPLFLRWGPARGPLGIEKTREGILPVGTTLEFTLLPAMKMSVDYRFYFVRTDKMDATSGQRLINPEEAESYSSTPDDKFSFLSLSLNYKFGKPK